MRKYFFFFIFIISIYEVLAIGIGPSTITVEFTPGLTQTINYALINSKGEVANGDIYVYLDLLDPLVKEQLKDSFVLSQTDVNFKEGEKNKKFKVTMTLPNEIYSGRHDVRIGVVEIPGGEGTLVIRVANEGRLFIDAIEGMPGVLKKPIIVTSTSTTSTTTTSTVPESTIQPETQQEGRNISFLNLFIVVSVLVISVVAILLIVYFFILKKQR